MLCLSSGKWYASGTQGTFTLKEVTGGSFIVSSSQGPCTVSSVDKLLGCAAGNTGTEFVIVRCFTLSVMTKRASRDGSDL
jgi:hypothetical protein